ncbi:MAG: PEP-CTERM sorting domain-containing protein [Blastochloris sp.]|nr:PEP-CTERM sorting domain-containing protein [Blastochloris sp.]
MTDTGNSGGISTISFTNQSGGVLTQAGEVNFQRLKSGGSGNDNGTITYNNQGTWIVDGNAAALNLRLRSAASTVTLNLNNSGTLRGSGANDVLEYTRFNTTGLAGTTGAVTGRALITNTGVVSPGAGHDGSGLTTVGQLTLRDLDLTFSGVDATLRLDIGGTGAGQFDVLSLADGLTSGSGAGALTLDGNSKLQLYYVNSFNPIADYSLTILNYGSRTGAFDLLSNLSIFNATGDAANVANYSITYNSGNAVLNFTAIPEPSTYALLGLGLGALWVLRRRNAPRAK